MGGGGSFNYQQAKSNSQAESGLRGTQYQDAAAAAAARSGQYLEDTVRGANTDLTKYQGQTGSQLLPGGQYGLGSNADPAVQQMMKYAFGQASGSAGQRGQLSPENLSGVAGSAVTNSLPSLMPYIQQWQLSQFQAPMSLNQMAVANAQAPANNWNQALGAQSQSNANSYGFGVSGGSTK